MSERAWTEDEQRWLDEDRFERAIADFTPIEAEFVRRVRIITDYFRDPFTPGEHQGEALNPPGAKSPGRSPK